MTFSSALSFLKHETGLVPVYVEKKRPPNNLNFHNLMSFASDWSKTFLTDRA